MEYLREVGPDTMMPCFAVNVKGNSDLNLVNDIVQAIFRDLCMSDDRVASFRFPMLITASTFAQHSHSIALKEFKKRLGVSKTLTASPPSTSSLWVVLWLCEQREYFEGPVFLPVDDSPSRIQGRTLVITWVLPMEECNYCH